METLLWIVAVLLVLTGLVGVVLPAVPGVVLVFIGLVVAAWADGFTDVGGWTIGVLALMTLLAYAVDMVAAAFGARRFGASARAMAGAAVGFIIGIFLGLPGIILGPFLGAVIGEYTVRRDLKGAGRAGLGTWLGMVFGIAVRVTLVFAMIGVFVLAYVW